MIMGGVPYYWDLLRKDIGFAQNIDALFFAAHGELSEEFDHLFLSLFRKPKLYISIIRALGTRKCGMSRNEIIAAIGATGNGMLTRALKELAQCDFIRVYAEPGRRKRDLIYQLIDNYVLFYFRFIDGQTNLMPNFWSVSQTTVVGPYRRYGFAARGKPLVRDVYEDGRGLCDGEALHTEWPIGS